jgi:hypothetical protein
MDVPFLDEEISFELSKIRILLLHNHDFAARHNELSWKFYIMLSLNIFSAFFSIESMGKIS